LADRVGGTFSGDRLGDPVADQLLTAIREAGMGGLDHTAQSAVFGRHKSTAELGRARELLVRRGLIEERTQSTGGRDRRFSVAKQANDAN
jgi:hypothetical protein